MLQISEQVQAIVELLTAYSTHGIADSDALAALLQHAGDERKFNELGELSFRAKHLGRVFNTAAKHAADSDLHAKLQEECSTSVQEFHQLLTSFIADASAPLKELIDSRYLAVTPEALRQLLRLAGDLEALKNWELDMTAENNDQ